jgi:MFS family permease
MLLASVAVWAMAAASEQLLLLRAADLGVRASLIPGVWFGVGLCKSAAAKVAGPLVDRLSPKRALAAGWLLFAAAYGGLSVAGHWAAFLPIVALVAVAYGLIEPAERALVSRLSPHGRQESSFGWYTLVQGLAGVPAALLAGSLWRGGEGAPAAFAASAGLAALAAVLLAGLVHPPRLDRGPPTADIGDAPGT